MEKQHFSHDHPLRELECTAELCAGCRSDINGLAFGCNACRFYLHKLCANLPRKFGDLWDPDEVFQLQISPSVPGDEYFHCRKCCHCIYEQGFVYVAYGYNKDFDPQIRGMLHVDCALLRYLHHKHSLVYINERKLFCKECAECGAQFHETEYEVSRLYGCLECGDAFHKECLDLSAQITREINNPHDLSGYWDPVPWDYNEWDYYFFDGCKE
ncbi:hypothetical protein Ancab_021682, partial [Ancistrocladus abbreviatus]